MNANKLQEGLRTKLFGKYIFSSQKIDSTNNWAKKLAELGAPEGTVAIAETQKAGRGRLGRQWFSPSGGLWFSIILKPYLKPSETTKLVFVASLAVAEALNELYGIKAETKWPNDVLVDGRKICGILAEMSTVGERVKFVVLGVGINANFDVEKDLPKDLLENTTSLKAVLKRKVELEELFKKLLEKLDEAYEQFLREGFYPILERWKSYARFIGHIVEVKSEGEKLSGLALDVNGEGALVLKLRDGTVRRVFVGDLSIK